MKEFFVRKIENNCLITPGIDWGRPMQIIHQAGDFFVVKRNAHQFFGGIGLRSFAPTFYALYRLEIIDRGFQAFEIEKHEPGHYWKPIVKQLKQRCDELYQASA